MSDFSQLADLLVMHREVGPLSSLMLTEESKVFVVGAYEGNTVAFLDQLYKPQIYAFEPQDWAIQKLNSRFAGRPNVCVCPYGLGATTGTRQMYEYGNDACSFVPLENSRTQGMGHIRAVYEEWPGDGLHPLDLVLVNIEGGEYELLDAMFQCHITNECLNLLVQFHQIERFSAELTTIEARLSETHDKVWNIGTSWVWWRLKC